MKNIMHLEDTAFFLPPEQIMELMAQLIMNVAGDHQVGDISLKYDGLFLAFGNRDGFFISDKGFLNKTPRILRSPEEIMASGLQQDKQMKLLWAFKCLNGTRIMPDLVLYADWLFDHFTLEDAHAFQPNLLKYRSKRSLNDYVLGLAVHTQNFCGVEMPSCWSSSFGVYYAPTKLSSLNKPEFPNYQDLFNYLARIKKGPLPEGQLLKSLRSRLNTIVKENNNYKREQLDYLAENSYPTLQNNLDALIKFKYKLLDYMELVDGEHKDFEITLEGKPTTHEGYVFRSNSTTVKLVDRYMFSKHNFNKSISRGWAKDGLQGINRRAERIS